MLPRMFALRAWMQRQSRHSDVVRWLSKTCLGFRMHLEFCMCVAFRMCVAFYLSYACPYIDFCAADCEFLHV